MMTIPDDLALFLDENRDSREYRRALAAKLALQVYMVEFIADMLNVSPSFVSKAKKRMKRTALRASACTIKVHSPIYPLMNAKP